MLLTIDIGNTNMVFGIYKGEEMLGSFRLSTNSTATSDELGILAVSYFERFGTGRRTSRPASSAPWCPR